MESRKRKRCTFSLSQKQDVIRYHEKHAKASQQAIADHFSVVWACDVKRRTIGDILQQRDKLMAIDTSDMHAAKRQRTAKHTDLEEALFLWFSDIRAKNAIVTDDILREKAKQFGVELNITDFSYSNGWLHRFKQRHGIANHVLSGESAGVDRQLISDGQERAVLAMRDYALKDIYNMDETGLFYRMLPDRSLSTTDKTKGTKKLKERLTVALACNADGSDKLRPLVIGHAKKPRCFKNFNHKLYVDYDYNAKAWMMSALFSQWLKDVDKQMKRKKRQILLIKDNAPTNIIPDNLRHIKIHFLPPTTTSHLQPLDAGIIQSFKSHFRRQQLKLIIDQLDTVGRHRVEVSDAIRFTKRAWDAVTPDTIKHCWQHTKLVPRDALTTDSVIDATTDSITDNDDDDIPLAELLRRATAALNIDSDVTMTADEFVTVDKDVELFSDMSDEAIMDIVKGTENNPDCSDEDPEPEPEPLHPKTTLSDINVITN